MNLQKAFDAGFEAVKKYVDASFEQFEKDMAKVKAETLEITARLNQAICDAENKIIELQNRKLEKGEPGPPGKDADPNEIAQRLLPEIEKLRLSIEPPKDGKDGKDGAGIIDAIEDSEGRLVLVFEDGRTKTLGKIRGEPGKNGRGFDKIDAFDDGENWCVRFTSGDQTEILKFRKPDDRDWYDGVWKQEKYRAGRKVTYGGSLWLSLVETEQKPGSGEDWKLQVKRGRDGRDGKNGERGERGERGLPGRDGRDLTQLDTSGVKY